MSKCDFNKVAKQLYWNCTSVWVFSCKFGAYFQNTFLQEHLCIAASGYTSDRAKEPVIYNPSELDPPSKKAPKILKFSYVQFKRLFNLKNPKYYGVYTMYTSLN